MKASQLIKAILQEPLVQASEAPIEAVEAEDAIFALNNWMFEIAADGVNLGFTEVTDLADEVTVPRGAVNGIVKNVAAQIVNQFGVAVPPLLMTQAAVGLAVMTKIAVTIPDSPYPGTLPIGSGNECGLGTHFYGEDEAVIETENGLTIVPESNTGIP